MRLIDVDLYCATICRCNRRACDRAKCPIHNAPTSYDIDKVVEELEKLKDKGSVTKTEMLITKACVDKAIEIVKHDCAADDVCEWKKSKDYPFDWIVGCDGCEVNHRQGYYCPRCGKKIKVVE